eukprot:TRINITY_DN27223_c0_g1_i1.p1 TRINITY_DN27223_c0_g1~~TRINITY_DN27223_c0_g1_i1.p1  ORF type:complete len:161 (+),score=33.39 TRINITY_DN27223_c0_g1_i1:36-485(+)
MADQRLSRLDKDIEEIFMIFNVRNSDTIHKGDLTVALRMLGVEVSKEVLRTEILPNYAEFSRLSAAHFKEIYRSQEAASADLENVFVELDRDKSGVISSKSLQLINSDLVAQGLEKTSHTVEEIEKILMEVFSTDHITKERFKNFMDVK